MLTIATPLLGLLPCLLAPLVSSGQDAQTPPAPRCENVIVVVLDDVGWGDWTPHVPMPNVAALAKEGLVFHRFYGMPVCSPSRFAMLTGELGTRHGLGTIVNTSKRFSAPSDLPTVARRCEESGVSTCLVGKWHLASPRVGAVTEHVEQFGFGAWRAGTDGNLRNGEDYGGRPRLKGWERIEDGERTHETRYNPTVMTDAAIDWWRTTEGRKFLWLAHNAPHTPYQKPPDELLPAGSSDAPRPRGAYVDMIQAVDTELGRLLAAVDLERTAVVVLADNGTPEEVVPEDSASPNAKSSVAEPGVRVPLVIGGGVRPLLPGVATNHVAHAADLAATVLDLLGVDRGTKGFRDSQSLVPLLDNPYVDLARDWAFVQHFKPNGSEGKRGLDDKAVVFGEFKLKVDGLTGRETFYDLRDQESDTIPTHIDFLQDEAKAHYERARAILAELGEG